MKKYPSRNNSRLEDAEEQISNLEDMVVESSQFEQYKEKKNTKQMRIG